MLIDRRAFARAGLLGNPSDGYFGRTISILVRNFGAHVILYESPDLHLEPHETDLNLYRNLEHLMDSVGLTGYYGGNRLVKAAIKTFHDHCRTAGIGLHARNFSIRYDTSIPRQVGLAGSSAIITATFRALMDFYGVEIPLEVLPTLVLSAETDELGIQAGLQDRVIQAYEGCVYMDFDKAHMEAKGYGKYERLDPSLLPMLYIAYKTDLSKVSGKVHNSLRARYDAGDDPRSRDAQASRRHRRGGAGGHPEPRPEKTLRPREREFRPALQDHEHPDERHGDDPDRARLRRLRRVHGIRRRDHRHGRKRGSAQQTGERTPEAGRQGDPARHRVKENPEPW